MGRRESDRDGDRRDLDRRRQDRSFYLQLAGFSVVILSMLAGFVRQATVMDQNAKAQTLQIDELRKKVDNFIATNQQNAVVDAEKKAEQRAAIDKLKEDQAEIKMWKAAIDEWKTVMNGKLEAIKEQQRK